MMSRLVDRNCIIVGHTGSDCEIGMDTIFHLISKYQQNRNLPDKKA